ncbi:MAG: aldo/keto reductase [Armatimonadota bacterium]|nr:aldo/keto reductase [Armatimonadota bacterium]
MKYRRLGTAGLQVSVLGLGCNTFGRDCDADQTGRVVHAALDLGITFFDTADVYGGGRSEEYLGRALEGRRDRAIVATKVGWSLGEGPNEAGVSRARIMAGIERSLKRLRTDYVDLYQIHRWDPHTPLDESLGALDDLVRQGKVRYIGCSNFAAWQMVWGLWVSDGRHWPRFVTVQPEYSLLRRDVETELLPACQAFGVGVIPYFPLAGGMLTGKYREGQPAPAGTRGHQNERFARLFMSPRNFAIVRSLEAWAQARGHTVAELAIAWLLARPAVCTVITGTTKPEQVAANARATEWELTTAEADEVAALAA